MYVDLRKSALNEILLVSMNFILEISILKIGVKINSRIITDTYRAVSEIRLLKKSTLQPFSLVSLVRQRLT